MIASACPKHEATAIHHFCRPEFDYDLVHDYIRAKGCYCLFTGAYKDRHMNTPYQVVSKDTCAWPNVFHIKDGKIGAVIFNRPSHGLEEGSLDFWTTDATDPGAWRLQSCPCPHEPGENRMHSACGLGHDGTIHILSTGYKVANRKYVSFQPMWHSCSNDNGQTWSITKDIPINGFDKRLIPHGSVLAGEDGKLYTTGYISFGKGNPGYTMVLQGDTRGKSWKLFGRIGEGDTNECHMVAMNKNLWLAATRTHVDHHTRIYRSEDEGKSWHDSGHLTLPMQHPGHLLRLNNTSLVCTYGIRNRGFMGIGARISLDNGVNWLAPVHLYQFPETTTDCGYPFTVRIDEDTCITGCYTDSSTLYNGYQFGVITWKLSSYLAERQLRSISDRTFMRI